MKKNYILFTNCSIVLFLIIISFLLWPLASQASNTINTYTSSSLKDPEGKIIGFLGDPSFSKITPSNVVYHIMNKRFFLKNAFSGQYLDVSNGTAESFTNVWQYPYNGSSAQSWYINYNNDGTFTFYSDVGNNMVLDVDNANPNDGANIHIHEYNGSDAQKFKIGYTDSSTYVIVSQVSNFSKSISTCNSGCTPGENVHQYNYAGLWSERWILEPLEKDVDLGALYSTDNYNKTVYAYPRFTDNFGGDCTNFVSQCMLASGIHFKDDWNILRKNGDYTFISSVSQLNNSWSLSDPSPWISAEAFKNYWVSHVSQGAYKATGQQILDNPNMIWNTPVTQGCVVQTAKKEWNGNVGEAHHSMYVSGYGNYGSYETLLLSYHSNDTVLKSLLDVCKTAPNDYFLFYVF